MRTDLEWCELHSPLFLSGTNLGLKLDPSKRTGLHLAFDEDKRHLYVTYNGKTARVPETSVLSMVEGQAKTVRMITPPTGKPIEVQVETPTSHVFAGAGGGTTGQEAPKVKK